MRGLPRDIRDLSPAQLAVRQREQRIANNAGREPEALALELETAIESAAALRSERDSLKAQRDANAELVIVLTAALQKCVDVARHTDGCAAMDFPYKSKPCNCMAQEARDAARAALSRVQP